MVRMFFFLILRQLFQQASTITFGETGIFEHDLELECILQFEDFCHGIVDTHMITFGTAATFGIFWHSGTCFARIFEFDPEMVSTMRNRESVFCAECVKLLAISFTEQYHNVPKRTTLMRVKSLWLYFIELI
jgi:hypothetical protein